MSRLIVKNLPAYLTQDRLRKYFEAPEGPGGTLTDVKLVLKPDGTSRRFGFVGFKSPQEAERAKKWFNRSFIDSSRVTVDIVDVSLARIYCFPLVERLTTSQGAKDAPAPRPNKRPRLGPSPSEHDEAVVRLDKSKKTKTKSSVDDRKAKNEM